MTFNLFVDESCHLEHDKIPVMCIGYIKVPKLVYEELREALMKVKLQFQTPAEIKWSKFSDSRKSLTRSLTRERIYDCNRANRIHWIKPILLSHPCNDIKYYKWHDDDGVCKDHYWFYAKDFMVVLKDLSQDTQIVTAFCVDKSQKLTLYERFRDYQQGNGNC